MFSFVILQAYKYCSFKLLSVMSRHGCQPPASVFLVHPGQCHILFSSGEEAEKAGPMPTTLASSQPGCCTCSLGVSSATSQGQQPPPVLTCPAIPQALCSHFQLILFTRSSQDFLFTGRGYVLRLHVERT